MVVDDQEQNIVLLENILRGAGYTNLTSMTNATQVLACFLDAPPDLILLDLHMGPVDGFAVMEQLQPLIPEASYLPIVILTGDASMQAKLKALTMGARDFVAKPVSAVWRQHKTCEGALNGTARARCRGVRSRFGRPGWGFECQLPRRVLF